MAAPEDRPEIAKLKDDITIPTALVQLVRLAQRAVLFVVCAAAYLQDRVPTLEAFARRSACPPSLHLPELKTWTTQYLAACTVLRKRRQREGTSLRCSCGRAWARSSRTRCPRATRPAWWWSWTGRSLCCTTASGEPGPLHPLCSPRHPCRQSAASCTCRTRFWQHSLKPALIKYQCQRG